MTRHRWLITGLAVAALALGACNSGTSSAPKTEAITIVEDEASGLKTLTLSEKAAQRLGVETAEVGGAGSGMTIPYAAMQYRYGVYRAFAVEGDRLEARELKTGDRVGDRMEILAGLTTQDRVAVTEVDTLTDGMKIAVNGE